MKATDVLEHIKDRLGDAVHEAYMQVRKVGVSKRERYHIWVKIDRKKIRDAVNCLAEIQPYPHLCVISGYDDGDNVVLVYHFVINYETKKEAISVNFSVHLPKNDLCIDTITDLIPGALITEREKIEMLGVDFIGLEDKRRVFLPDDFPEGVYPWRRDEKGPEKMLHKLYEVGDRE
ncbi:MAG: NADH-quinone oxidoreductase subunit C [Thermoplasmata archaeon]|nr:MAG: NADH-quinone oxidoreductase subunit C [Thermoplasmata archaeon]